MLELPFLATHYMVERHHEALFWSFVVAWSDRDHSGTVSYAEREALLSEIGYMHNYSTETPIHIVLMPKRGLEPCGSSIKECRLNASIHYSVRFHIESGWIPLHLA